MRYVYSLNKIKNTSDGYWITFNGFLTDYISRKLKGEAFLIFYFGNKKKKRNYIEKVRCVERKLIIRCNYLTQELFFLLFEKEVRKLTI